MSAVVDAVGGRFTIRTLFTIAFILSYHRFSVEWEQSADDVAEWVHLRGTSEYLGNLNVGNWREWVFFQALAQMARENNGQIVCPKTKEVFPYKKVEKVFVM